jgi:type IV pilus assembly protein PilW
MSGPWNLFPARGRGFTLLELMVALAIGALLIAGVLRIFQSNKQTYRLQDALSRVQENARFSTMILREKVRQAGFKAEHEEVEEVVFPPLTRNGLTSEEPPSLVYSLGNISLAAAQVVAGTDDNADASDNIRDGTDTVLVRYQGARDGTTRDCIGNLVPANNLQIDLYYVNDRDTALHCASCDTACQGGQPATDQTLVEGLESLQILYGLVTDPNSFHDVRSDCFIDASNVVTTTVSDCTSGLNFSQVASVRAGLLLQTPGNTGRFLRDHDDTATYDVAGTDVTVNDTQEHRVRRVFATTIGLRNRIK